MECADVLRTRVERGGAVGLALGIVEDGKARFVDAGVRARGETKLGEAERSLGGWTGLE
jgi:hypothetical protein